MIGVDLTVDAVKILIENGIKVCDMEPDNQRMQYLKLLFQQQYALLSSSWERQQKFLEQINEKN